MAQDPYKYFRPEAHEILEQFSRGALELEKGEGGAAVVQKLLRLAHTLKGAARVVKQPEIANRAHAIEDVLAPLRDCAEKPDRGQVDALLQHLDAIGGHLAGLSPQEKPVSPAVKIVVDEAASRTVRTNLAEADAVLDGVVEAHALMNGLHSASQSVEQAVRLADLLVSEFSALATDEHRRAAKHSSRHLSLAEELRRKIIGIDRNLGSVVDQMDRELRQLREATERLRLVPVESLVTTLERAARDTARALSKQVTFKCTGADVRLDAHVLDTLQGALVQIIRNAVAHGIEAAEERARAGKPPVGQVTVAVSRRQRRIVISCDDDGRGVDLDAVRRAASQRGTIGSQTRDMTSADLLRLLLRGGISTSKTITEESGRGVGLDVVREAVERLGGEVDCRSTPRVGTTFEIVIPPSLSSVDALIVQAGGHANMVAIPLEAIRSTRRLRSDETTFTGSGASVLHDDQAIPVLPLSSMWGGLAGPTKRSWTVVVVAGTEGLAAIGVERLFGTARVVLRPLPQRMTASAIVAGASLDADGNPQLVLDPDGLVAAARRGDVGELDSRPAKRPVLVVDDSLTTRMLEQSILESAGYDVDVAESGEEALKRLNEKDYALILCDVEMPGMDGFTFIERIRSDSRSHHIPAILVTSLAAPEHRKRGRDVGAQGYIEKSEFDQAELLSMIKPMMAA
jgi:two-component system, chemotaxis family, sensor kinase CheA